MYVGCGYIHVCLPTLIMSHFYRVGDRILEINGLSMLGKSPSEIHAVLSKLKWGEEVNIFVFHPQETLKFQKSDTDNAGIIAVKVNTVYTCADISEESWMAIFNQLPPVQTDLQTLG